MRAMRIEIGDQVRFSKTVGEYDVYAFAGITGDFYGAHVDEEFMRASAFGQRIAHGALLVGFMSTASTMMIAQAAARGDTNTPLSIGYDHLRFLAPVFFGDTVTVAYTITQVDDERRRSVASIEVSSQRSELVAVAEHLMKWIAAPPPITPQPRR